MKKTVQFTSMLFLLFISMQCSTSKVVSINSEIAITEAKSTPIQINNQEGARLNFTILAYKEVSLNSVYYWEKQTPLTIIKENGDTIWAKAEITKPNLAKAMKESTMTPEVVRPVDTTCVLNYTFNGDKIKLPIPRLEKCK